MRVRIKQGFWFRGREYHKDDIVTMERKDVEELRLGGLVEVRAEDGGELLRVVPSGFGLRR